MNELSKEYVTSLLATTSPLESQGDGMRSFATVLLHVLVADNYSVQFLDEPEAFLHPPQARLLGQFIAKERRAKAQLFVATHSPEILEGILTASSAKVRIVRIQQDGSINRIKELSKEKTTAIANDPLTRYSRVLSGIFHQRVIIAESDSDCLFYSSILATKAVSGSSNPDVLFVHAGGKHRMKQLAETLRSLDVPVSVIADIDILNERETFKELYETLGGVWEQIESHWTALSNHLQTLRPPLDASQVKQRIEDELKALDVTKPFSSSAGRNIRGILKSLSPWDHIKTAGRNAIGRGQPILQFDQLLEKCGTVGLWIVPVGELEGFCRTIEARHGPDFAMKVLSQRDIETDPELEDARQFMRAVWGAAS